MRKIGLLLAVSVLMTLLFGACGNSTALPQSDSADAITPTARGGSAPVGGSSTTGSAASTSPTPQLTGDQRGEISSDGQSTRIPSPGSQLNGTTTAQLTNPSGTTVAPATTGVMLNTPGALATQTGNPLVDGTPQPTLPSREITPQPGGPNSSLMTPGSTPTALSVGTPVGNLTDPMTESLRGLSGKDFEISFLQQMIVHHQMAVDMAQLVPTRSKRAEINKLAQDIIQTQTGEMATMRGYLQTWHSAQPLASDAAVPGRNDMMMHMSHLQSLQGDDFDRQFMREMLTHHGQALNMSNLISTRSQRPELIQLGQNIIQAQTREMEQIRSWLANFK